jgi:hypothetical protein
MLQARLKTICNPQPPCAPSGFTIKSFTTPPTNGNCDPSCRYSEVWNLVAGPQTIIHNRNTLTPEVELRDSITGTEIIARVAPATANTVTVTLVTNQSHIRVTII